MLHSALPNFYMGLAFSGNCGRTFFFFSPSTTETETDDELKNWKKGPKQSGEDMPNSYSATLLFKYPYHYDYKWYPIYSLTTNYHHINKSESNYTNIKSPAISPFKLPCFCNSMSFFICLFSFFSSAVTTASLTVAPMEWADPGARAPDPEAPDPNLPNFSASNGKSSSPDAPSSWICSMYSSSHSKWVHCFNFWNRKDEP